MKGITMRDLTVSSQNVREEFLMHPSSHPLPSIPTMTTTGQLESVQVKGLT